MRRWFPFLVIFALGMTMVLSVGASADPTRHGRMRRAPRWGGAYPAADPYPGPCQSYPDPDAPPNPCPTSGGTGSTASTTGSSSGTTAGTTSTTSGSTTGTTATTAGTTGTTAGSPNPGPPNPSPTAGGTAGTTSTAGGGNPPGGGDPPTDPTTGSSTGGTTGGGTGGGGWDASSSGTTLGDSVVNGLVTGTNDNVTFTLVLNKPAQSPWKKAYIDSVDVWIGGEQDSHLPTQTIHKGLDPGQGSVVSCAFPVRYASTRFQDGAHIALNATFHYYLSNDTSQSSPITYSLPTVNLIAYNKGLALATTQFVADDGGYDPEYPPQTPYYDWASQLAVMGKVTNGTVDPTETAPVQLAAMHHSLVENDLADPSKVFLSRNTLLANDLPAMTAFFAFTHGEPTCFLDSFGTVAAGSDGAVRLDFGAQSDGTKSQVGKAVWGDPANTATYPLRTVPRPNLVVLHACSGLQAGQKTGQAFGLLRTGQFYDDTHPVREGRAYTGFQYPVITLLMDVHYPQDDSADPNHHHSFDSSKKYIQDHAKIVYANLVGGKTIGQAVKAANEACHPAYVPAGVPNAKGRQRMDMKAVIDPYARLISVYTGNDDASTRPANEQGAGYYPYRWYLPGAVTFFPNPPPAP